MEKEVRQVRWMDTQLGRGVSALGPGPTAGRKARVGFARGGLEI